MKRIFAGTETIIGDDDLGIARDKLAGIIEHARIFDTRESNGGTPRGSNSGEDVTSICEDSGGDTVGHELVQPIRDLEMDGQASLVALAWSGRGTDSASEWNEAASRARQAHNSHTAEYLLSLPLLPDYLENGLAELDALAAVNTARELIA